MAQSTDITLANQSGLAFRTELNSILAALSSLQSGSSEPSTTNAYQLWVDTSTTPGKLKIRNGANSAWIVVADDITAVNLGLIAASGGTFTGDVTMNAQSDVRFADADSSNYVALQGAATISSNLTFTLPTSYGSSGQFLETAGDGTVSFSSLPVGSTSQQGILQLTNSTSSTSTTTAATPDSVRSAYSLANSALPKSGGQMTGNITFSGTQTVDGRDLSADGSKLDGIEASADVTDATNVDAAGAVMNSDTSTAAMSFVIDEDNMSSNSATKVPTQQSVKAYVDASGGGGGASAINDLSDAVTNSSGQTIGLGTGALANDDGSTRKNTAVGYQAGNDTTSGDHNCFFGYQAGEMNTIGAYNVAIGDSALLNNTSAYFGVATGMEALKNNTTGGNNVATGGRALLNNTTGADNVATGYSALGNTTTGSDNVANGYYALRNNTTGSGNVGVGYQAAGGLGSDRALFQTVGIGYNALANTTGNSNTAVGYQAGKANTTGSVTAFGRSAGLSNTTGGVTAFGNEALKDNTTGLQNTAVGESALDDNLTGSYNTAVGHGALTANTTGFENSAFGWNALNAITTGSYNTGLGKYAGDLTTTGNYNTTVGYEADPSSATASGQFTLGNTNVSALRCNVTSITSLSDGRDKTEVEDLPVGLDFIDSLRPVKFQWQTRDGNSKDGTYDAGFIAQDLQSAQSAADADYLGLVMDDNPDRLEASYGKLVPMLVKAIQELKSEVEQLKANA